MKKIILLKKEQCKKDMANLKTVSGQTAEVADNSPLMDAAEQLGVPFGCRAGVCGTCKVTVTEGAQNLGDKTDNEQALGLGENERCMCQAKIKTGDVIIDW